MANKTFNNVRLAQARYHIDEIDETLIPLNGEVIWLDSNSGLGFVMGDGVTQVGDLHWYPADNAGELGIIEGSLIMNSEDSGYEESTILGSNSTTTSARGTATGDRTSAGWRSHTEGYMTTANNTSHAEGRLSIATGKAAHAEGVEGYGGFKLDDNEILITLSEDYHIDNNYLYVNDTNFNPDGLFIILGHENQDSFATDVRKVIEHNDNMWVLNAPFKDINYDEANTPNGDGIIPAGSLVRQALPVIASGRAAHAEGYLTVASGASSHAEGGETLASGLRSHAEGSKTTATKETAHAEGYNSHATGHGSHAEGYGNTASGAAAHVEGRENLASGARSHAEGGFTQATAYCAHAEGIGTIASGRGQHVEGQYNIEDSTKVHIVGWGTSSERKNIHTLDTNGNAWYLGGIRTGGTIQLGDDGGYDLPEITIAGNQIDINNPGDTCLEITPERIHSYGEGTETPDLVFDRGLGAITYDGSEIATRDYVNSKTLSTDEDNTTYILDKNIHLANHYNGDTFGTWLKGDELNLTFEDGEEGITKYGINGIETDATSGFGIYWNNCNLALPAYTGADEGKILQIVNGVPTWVSPSDLFMQAEEVDY